MIEIPIKLVANKINWTTLSKQVKGVEDWFYNQSFGKVNLKVDIEHTEFTDIPWSDYGKEGFITLRGVDRTWYDQNVTPRGSGYSMVCFLLDYQMWRGTGARGWRTDMNQGPVELQVGGMAEKEKEPDWAGLGSGKLYTAFQFVFEHEIMHGLFLLSGQEFSDTTHKWWNAGELNRAFEDINYSVLETRVIKKGQQDMIVRIEGEQTLAWINPAGEAYEIATAPELYESVVAPHFGFKNFDFGQLPMKKRSDLNMVGQFRAGLVLFRK